MLSLSATMLSTRFLREMEEFGTAEESVSGPTGPSASPLSIRGFPSSHSLAPSEALAQHNPIGMKKSYQTFLAFLAFFFFPCAVRKEAERRFYVFCGLSLSQISYRSLLQKWSRLGKRMLTVKYGKELR
jgi:hypothetical protein